MTRLILGDEVLIAVATNCGQIKTGSLSRPDQRKPPHLATAHVTSDF